MTHLLNKYYNNLISKGMGMPVESVFSKLKVELFFCIYVSGESSVCPLKTDWSI